MSKATGGLAFPAGQWHDPQSGKTHDRPGMTLRDYFAAKAIQGIFANDAMLARFSHDGARDLIDPEVMVATAAYSIADAMLAERTK